MPSFIIFIYLYKINVKTKLSYYNGEMILISNILLYLNNCKKVHYYFYLNYI